jgi:hypothetical protein
MVKPSHLKIIFLLLSIPMVIIVSFTISASISAPEALLPLTTKAKMLSNDNPDSLISTPAQKSIPASKASITIDDFKFRIAKVTIDETVMFVEFELLAGNEEAFKALEITVAYNSGQKSKAFILTSGGIVQMLSSVTVKGTSSDYQPGEDNIAWAFVIHRGVDKFYLNFPTGEVVDLAPLIK